MNPYILNRKNDYVIIFCTAFYVRNIKVNIVQKSFFVIGKKSVRDDVYKEQNIQCFYLTFSLIDFDQ